MYLDLGRLEYITAAGVGAIIRVAQRARTRGGRLVLCNVQPLVREVFAIDRLDALPWLAVRGEGMPGGGKTRLPDPAWLAWGGGIVPALARTIAQEQDFTLMPVLADALAEAGCTSADLLDHLHGPRPHVRGCFALGLLVGR